MGMETIQSFCRRTYSGMRGISLQRSLTGAHLAVLYILPWDENLSCASPYCQACTQ